MIISSPLFNSKAKYAKCRADVALVTEIANFELTNLQTLLSRSLTNLPSDNHVDFKAWLRYFFS